MKHIGSVLVLLCLCSSTAFADPPPTGWSGAADFSYVLTSGNSEASTLGLKTAVLHNWGQSLFTLRAGAVRAESTAFTRFAVGTPTDFVLSEDKDTQLTAENYYLNGRFDRKISERFFWYAGAGWDRNQFAGIDNRYVVEGGVGNLWRDDDTIKFRTNYAATWTRQEDLVGTEDSFGGVRLGWDYLHKFTDSTTYGNTLIVDVNASETSDWRADMVNSVAVSMSKKLALKASLQWLYDNQPSFQMVPLFDAVGDPTGLDVPFQLDELDQIFTTSLVWTF